MRYLTTRDASERSLMMAIANGAREHQRQHDEQRAIQINNSIAKGLGG